MVFLAMIEMLNVKQIYPNLLPNFSQYSHYVIAGIQLEKSVTMFLSPLLFLIFIPDESSHAQWRNLFLAMAALLIIVLIFPFLCPYFLQFPFRPTCSSCCLPLINQQNSPEKIGQLP